MYQAAPQDPQDPNESSRMRRLTNPQVDGYPRTQLPVYEERPSLPPPDQPPPTPPPVAQQVGGGRIRWDSGCLTMFWTAASILSVVMNCILLAVLFSGYAYLRSPNDQASLLVKDLYTNFRTLDGATIAYDVPLDTEIPLTTVIPVQTSQTPITLSQDVALPAHVYINTSVLRLNAPATVTLRAGTVLPVNINFPLTVDTKVPVKMMVPVKIPLNQTELHQPFVNLQKAFEPVWCLTEPNTLLTGMLGCPPP